MMTRIVWIAVLFMTLQVLRPTNGQRCASGPCKNGALCEEDPDGYNCFCVDGYAGPNCEIDFDDCLSAPCRNNATCSDGVASYRCTCTPGFTGPECQEDIDECISTPCHRNGTCINIVNGYACECDEPFRGDNCNLLPCDILPCENDAFCRNDLIFNESLSGFACDCPIGFTGQLCEVNLEDCDLDNDTSCYGNGLCIDGVNDFSCLCEPGWVGEFCESPVNDCIGNECRNGASCKDRHLGYDCECPIGYDGSLCERERDECEVYNSCKNGALCVDLFNSYRCECSEGWYGINCTEQVNECHNNPCKNGATCIDLVGDFLCRCAPFYTGQLCETVFNPCAPEYNPCQNGANCVAPPDGQYRCFCSKGFTGAHCEVDVDECFSQPCKNNAICEDITAGYVCHCLLGWEGNDCDLDIDDCQSQPCINDAECFDLFNGFECNCTREYTGRLCDKMVDFCERDPCFHDGTCISVLGGYECLCSPPYTGSQCLNQIDACKNEPCANGGTCLNTVDGAVCNCPLQYTGDTCTELVNFCASRPCLNGGICNRLVNGYLCVCPELLTGKQCTEITDYCKDEPCKNGAYCINDVFKYRCSCLYGFAGVNCTEIVDFCRTNPCQNSANCSNVPGGFLCGCLSGYTGDLCENVILTTSQSPSLTSVTLSRSTQNVQSSLFTSFRKLSQISQVLVSSIQTTISVTPSSISAMPSSGRPSISTSFKENVLSSSAVSATWTSLSTTDFSESLTDSRESLRTALDHGTLSTIAPTQTTIAPTQTLNAAVLSTSKYFPSNTASYSSIKSTKMLSTGDKVTSLLSEHSTKTLPRDFSITPSFTIISSRMTNIALQTTSLSRNLQTTSVLVSFPETSHAELRSSNTLIVSKPSRSTYSIYSSFESAQSVFTVLSSIGTSIQSTKVTTDPVTTYITERPSVITTTGLILLTSSVDAPNTATGFTKTTTVSSTTVPASSKVHPEYSSSSLQNARTTIEPSFKISSSIFTTISYRSIRSEHFTTTLNQRISTQTKMSTDKSFLHSFLSATTTSLNPSSHMSSIRATTEITLFSISEITLSSIGLLTDTTTPHVSSVVSVTPNRTMDRSKLTPVPFTSTYVSSSGGFVTNRVTGPSSMMTSESRTITLESQVQISKATSSYHALNATTLSGSTASLITHKSSFVLSPTPFMTVSSPVLLNSTSVSYTPISSSKRSSLVFTSESSSILSSDEFQSVSTEILVRHTSETDVTKTIASTISFASASESMTDYSSEEISYTLINQKTHKSSNLVPTITPTYPYSTSDRTSHDKSQLSSNDLTTFHSNTLETVDSVLPLATRYATSTSFGTLKSILTFIPSYDISTSDSLQPLRSVEMSGLSTYITEPSSVEISSYIVESFLSLAVSSSSQRTTIHATSSMLFTTVLSTFHLPESDISSVLEKHVSSYIKSDGLSTLYSSFSTYSKLSPIATDNSSSSPTIATLLTEPVTIETSLVSPITTVTASSSSLPTVTTPSTRSTTSSPSITCDDNICLNSGTCREDQFGLYCDCIDGFIGQNCDTETSACDGFVCENGGSCTVAFTTFATQVPRCNCPLPFMGTRCNLEILIFFPSFLGSSYLEFPPPTITSDQLNELYISVKTTNPDGTILYSGIQDLSTPGNRLSASFIQLRLNSGIPVFEFSCDGAVRGSIVGDKQINSGDIYEVIIRLVWPAGPGDWCTAALVVNDKAHVSRPLLSLAKPQVLGNLYLGGVPRYSYNGDVISAIHIIKGFIGCIRNLQINGQEMDLIYMATKSAHIENCNVPVCQNNPCKNGATCHSSGEEWYCSCSYGYAGVFCERKLCDPDPCHHGGTCVVLDKENDQLCLCPFNRGGTLCEKELSVTVPYYSGTQYGHTSYSVYALPHYIVHDFEAEFYMILDDNSTNDNVIMYMGTTGLGDDGRDFMALGLYRGYLVFLFDLGSGYGTVYSQHPLNLSIPHHLVKFGRSGNIAWLQPNNQRNSTGRSRGPLTDLNTKSKLYVGGYPNGITDAMSEIARFGDGMKGCIYHLRFRTHYSNLIAPGSPPGHVDEGRSVRQCNATSCQGGPCHNGAECVDLGASVYCNCTDGWTGPTCLDEKTVCDVTNSCAEGSTCVPVMSSSYKCLCPLGKRGLLCNEEFSISDPLFADEEAYMTFEPVFIRHTTDLTLQINPHKPDGLIFYVSQHLHSISGDFLAVMLHAGKVHLRFDVGSGLNIIQSPISIDNATWHTIQAGRNSTHGYLIVNDHVTVGMTTGLMSYLDTTTEFYLGGVPRLSEVTPDAFENDPVTFEGCIRELTVNGREYELTESGAIHGKNIDDCDKTSCGYRVCNHGGNCTSGSGTEYMCMCSNDFFGDHCEHPIECLNNTCLHGNCRVGGADDSRRFVCDCFIGWSGHSCDQVVSLGTTARVSDGGYIVVIDEKVEARNKSHTHLSLSFKTLSLNGLILWHGQTYSVEEDYLGVGLDNGRVKVVWNLGWYSSGDVITPSRFNDDEWHSVAIEIISQNMILTIDGSTYSSSVSGDFRDLDTGRMYNVGGFKQGSVKDSTLGVFDGALDMCVKELRHHDSDDIIFDAAHGGINVRSCG